jgi:exopolysaccharide production protein ExoQ
VNRSLALPMASGKWAMAPPAAGRCRYGIVHFWFVALLAFLPVFRTSFLLRRRDAGAFAAVDSMAMVQIVVVAVSALLLLGGKARASNQLVTRGPSKWLIVYLVFCALSMAWSTRPLFTLYRSMELMVTVFLLAHMLHACGTVERASKCIIWFAGFSSLSGVAYCIKRSGFNLGSLHTNAYTAPAAMGLTMAVALMLGARKELPGRGWSAGAGLCLLCLVLGTCSGSNGALCAGLVAAWVYRAGKGVSVARIMLLALGAYFLLTTFGGAVQQVVFPGKTTEQIYTLHNRTGFWKFYIDGFFQRPILGWGFAVGEKEAGRFGFGLTSSAHNGILSVAINTGSIGLLIFFGWLTSTFARFHQSAVGGGVWCAACSAALLAGLANNMTYPVVGSHWYAATSTFLLVALLPVVYPGKLAGRAPFARSPRVVPAARRSHTQHRQNG